MSVQFSIVDYIKTFSRETLGDARDQQMKLSIKMLETNSIASSSMQNLIDFADERNLDVQTRRMLRKYKERKQQEAKKNQLVGSKRMFYPIHVTNCLVSF